MSEHKRDRRRFRPSNRRHQQEQEPNHEAESVVINKIELELKTNGNDAPGPDRDRSAVRPPRSNDKGERKRFVGRDDRESGRRNSSGGLDISVVIPLLNEEDSLPELSSRLSQVLDRKTSRWEVIFIDDGSTDGSYQVIKEINRKDSRFKAIRFRRNYGKSAALAVGFRQASGDIVLTMDADLQDDPDEIPNLLAKLDEGYDLVSGWKRKRYDPIHKTLPSKFFNYVTSKASGIKLHDFNCGLKAYRRDVVKSVQLYGEMHRYIPALAHWAGFRVAEIPVLHHARKYGYSKFGFERFVKGFLDLLTVLFTTRYVKRPLHLFGTVGTLFGLAGFFIDAWLSVEWVLGLTSLSNRPLFLFGIALVIVGVQLFSFGLIAELVVKNSHSVAEYSVKERID